MPYTAIFCAANPDDDLGYLRQEFQDIASHFGNIAATGIVHPVINSNAKDTAVANAFLSTADIRIFHFSGHADQGLLWDDGKLDQLNILPTIIGNAAHLKLVFLNGCGTHDLVAKFLNNGASLVIATKTSVFDHIAYKFSSAFYDCLCNKNLSIINAYNAARLRVEEEVKGKLRELAGTDAIDKNSKEYARALKVFIENSEVRRIVKREAPLNLEFAWGVYTREDIQERLRADYESWTVKDPAPIVPIDHREPSFDFIKRLGNSINKLKIGLDVSDPHQELFSRISDTSRLTTAWGANATTDLINNLYRALLIPMKEPFRNLVNFSRDNRNRFGRLDIPLYRELLSLQLNLYDSFVRTAVIVMLSDFMESTIVVGFSENEELKGIYNEAIQANPDLFEMIRQTIDGSNKISKVDFAINVMRGVVSFLKCARQIVKRYCSETEKSDLKKKYEQYLLCFQQFINEYNGNAEGSSLDMAISNSIQEVLITIRNKLYDGSIDNAEAELLRCYCDRAETCLIKLFEDHSYLFIYEIITIGKVEAIKRRDRKVRLVNHEVLTLEGILTPPFEIEYGGEFTENYSVLLVSHRSHIIKYLSLSPFMMNVGPFFEEEISNYFYFNSRNGNVIEYDTIDYNDKSEDSSSTIQISLDSSPAIVDEYDDQTFLTISKEVIELDKKSNDLIVRARRRFAGIRDQFNKLQEQVLSLID